jgi:hypothetical protein
MPARLIGFTTDDQDLYIMPIEVNAVRLPLRNEFKPTTNTVIFAGNHKFGVCETIDVVVTRIQSALWEWYKP